MSGRWPYYEPDEIAAAVKCLSSGRVNYWTGAECRSFEKEFAAHHGVDYGIALANGTIALEVALQTLGIGVGDEVIVTPRSFFASASCVARVGATPVFADVDLDSQNISNVSIIEKITDRTKAVIVVHLAGWPCDMYNIMEMAKERGIYVIEDCAQAHGAKIDDRFVGSFGDVAAFSFCQDKIMSTAGEGGLLMTNEGDLFERAWSIRDHGKNRKKMYAGDHPPGFRWVHDSIGSNFRMTEIQGAVGRIQLKKLDKWVRRRNENATFLANELSDIKALRIPLVPQNLTHAFYRFYLFVRAEFLRPTWNRNRILSALEALQCPGLSGSCPEIYKEAAFSKLDVAQLPNAKSLGESSMALPVDPTLEVTDLEEMVQAVRQVFSVAAG